MLTHGCGNTCDPVSTCTGPTLVDTLQFCHNLTLGDNHRPVF